VGPGLDDARTRAIAETREVAVVDFGLVPAHAVTAAEALDIIVERAARGEGGFVLTPNVDHISMSARDSSVASAYGGCFLSLADGMPLVALSRLLGLPLRHKVSGSDLFAPLVGRCARENVPVFFVGATAAACEAAARKLRRDHPALVVAGYDSSEFDLETDPAHARAVLRAARDAGARLLLVCLPPRKQFAMLSRFQEDYWPAVAVGVGSALAFYVGEVSRAPAWMSSAGLEWLYRLWREPRRLWRRYLVQPVWAVPVFARMVFERMAGRMVPRMCRM